jgi:predicted nucleic acid-binding protein
LGPLALPASGSIYLDANIFIYTVERVDHYRSLLDPFWQEISARGATTLTSELTVLEVLTKPLRSGDVTLEHEFRNVLFFSPDVRLAHITVAVLERAAAIRATTNLKIPDAIHAATALIEGCAVFVTKDLALRRISAQSPGMAITVLDELITP